MRRFAFTLIELLVVMAVIAVMAGLILGSVSAVRKASQRGKTASILATVRVGLEATGAERGGLVAAAVHPLANNSGTRAIFVRGSAGPGFAEGDPVATSGEALSAPTPAIIEVSEVARLLLADDVFDDPIAPHLRGLDRRSLYVVGSGAGLVRLRRLPALAPRFDRAEAAGAGNGRLDTPYDHTKYNDNIYLEYTGDDPSALDLGSKMAVEAAFAQTARDELAALGALVANVSGDPIASGRLRRAASDDPRRAPPQVMEGGVLTPYALRGVGLYDAWGREILYRINPDGKTFSLISAGADGIFADNPAFPQGAADNVVDGRKDRS